MSELADMQLQHLYECSITSKYGLRDKGNPHVYAKLAAMKMVEGSEKDGYVITILGKETLKSEWDRLFGKRKRLKKKQKEREDYDEAS